MVKRVGYILVLVAQLVSMIVAKPSAYAVSPNLVIFQLQTGTTGAASQELITVYNNSEDPVDVTGWCVAYGSASDVTQTQLGCVAAPNVSTRLFLPSKAVLSLASNEFVAAHEGFVPDVVFSAGMSGASGHVRLYDPGKNEIDRLGWGSAVNPEGTAAIAHANGKILQRLSLEKALQDSDDNSTDFAEAVPGTLPTNDLYEEEIAVDVCPNIEGLQEVLPEGHLVDATGSCRIDVCGNLDGLQIDIPDGYQEKDAGVCGLIPLQGAALIITEILPNAASIDTGKEFIEIYNPNDQPIDLEGYVLQIGPSFNKSYPLPASQTIVSGQYLAISDSITGLVLPNSSARLRLVAPNGNIVSETDVYSSPKDDTAWALIGGLWQYTNQPTPGSANVTNLEESTTGDEEVSTLAPCPAGQYRNPDTNRCRMLQGLVSALTPCKAGQERNPETNRCRSVLAASTLTPCEEGQERNPDTNRCRSVGSSDDDLLPCDEGEERNPETNRCRKIGSAADAEGIDKVKDVASTAIGKSVKWWLAGAAAIAAVGYAFYEWRHDIKNYLYRKRSKPHTANKP